MMRPIVVEVYKKGPPPECICSVLFENATPEEAVLFFNDELKTELAKYPPCPEIIEEQKAQLIPAWKRKLEQVIGARAECLGARIRFYDKPFIKLPELHL